VPLLSRQSLRQLVEVVFLPLPFPFFCPRPLSPRELFVCRRHAESIASGTVMAHRLVGGLQAAGRVTAGRCETAGILVRGNVQRGTRPSSRSARDELDERALDRPGPRGGPADELDERVSFSVEPGPVLDDLDDLELPLSGEGDEPHELEPVGVEEAVEVERVPDLCHRVDERPVA